MLAVDLSDPTTARHLARALDDHAAWCKANGYCIPTALVELRRIAHPRATSGQDGAGTTDAVRAPNDAVVGLLLPLPRVAAELGYSDSTIKRLVREGRLPVVSVPGVRGRRVRREDLDAFVAALESKGAA